MDEHVVGQLKDAANAGIDALEANQVDQASVHFSRALDLSEEIQDGRTRRDELASLAQLLAVRFPDLALTAAEEAVELDRELGLETELPEDLIAVGNAHQNMENTEQAEKLFREALAIALAQNAFANAASANTNIGALAAGRGDLAEAMELFETSLGYLAQDSFDNTETQTRFALLQIYEFEECDVERALDKARELCDRLLDELLPMQQDAVPSFVEDLCGRYVTAHPEIEDGEAWRAATFPRIYQA